MLSPGQYTVNSDNSGSSQNGGSFTSLSDLLSSYGSQSASSSPSTSNNLLNPGFNKQYGYNGGTLDNVLSSNVLSTGASSGVAYNNPRSTSNSSNTTRFQSTAAGPSLYNPYANRSTTSTTASTPEMSQAEKDTSLVNVLARIGNQYNLKKSKTSAL